MREAGIFYHNNKGILEPFDNEYTTMIKMMEAFADEQFKSRVNEETIMKVLNDFIFRIETQEGNKLTVIDDSDFKEIAKQLLKQ